MNHVMMMHHMVMVHYVMIVMMNHWLLGGGRRCLRRADPGDYAKCSNRRYDN
jgi:hypothetical protein